MTGARQLWAATCPATAGDGLDAFLATVHGLCVTAFSHQNRLLDALRTHPLPDVLVLHHQFPGPLDPAGYLRLVREAAPVLRIIYLLPDDAGDGLLRELADLHITDLLADGGQRAALVHRIFYPRPSGEVRLLRPTAPLPPAAPGEAPASRVIETKVVGFWSPAGAGTTTLVANVAAYLAQDPSLQVAAADFNWATPNLALLLNLLENRNPYQHCLSHLLPALEGRRLTPAMLDAHLLPHPRLHNLRVLAGVFHPHALPRFAEEHCERLLASLRDTFHLVLVDLPPAIDALTTFITLEQAQQVLLVTSPAYAARFHLKRSLLQLEELGWNLDRFELVLNQAGRVPARQVAYELGLPVAAEVPALPGLDRLAERSQVPVLGAHRDAAAQAFCQGIARVADRIAPRLQPAGAAAGRFAFLRGR